MSKSEFIQNFSGIYELSPWVAEKAWQAGISENENTLEGITHALSSAVSFATEKELLELICKHPDLAGKAAISGQLTHASTNEQANAGLDQCSTEEFEQFNQLNSAYKKKFDFPFIFAVRNSNRSKILASFKERIHNDRTTEFNRAIAEIHNIARFRLEAIFTPAADENKSAEKPKLRKMQINHD